MASVYIETFGCQMNVADSNMLLDLFTARGYTQSANSADADIVIVNTCSVRKKAEQRAMARIGEYAGHKKKSGGTQQLWVVGCMAERLGESIKDEIPGVDRVIGATRVEYLSHDIDRYLTNQGRAAAGQVGISTFVPVTRGCDNFCTYCIVPHVRGREHSVACKEIKRQVVGLIEQGTVEIVLLGQNVNSYRDGSINFAGLIRQLVELEGLKRLRFTTSHPKDLSDELIDVIARSTKVCNHVHLPVQSGSTRILSAMNRGYTREHYLALIDKIRHRIPDVDLTTDVMVGFPGETEEDFKETLSLFEHVGFTTAFMFAYSPREGTAAAKMENQHIQETKKHRLNTLIATQTEITRSHYNSMVGKTVSALFTERQKGRDHAWMGQDFGAKRVLYDCDDNLAGSIIDVKIQKSSGMTLIAERI